MMMKAILLAVLIIIIAKWLSVINKSDDNKVKVIKRRSSNEESLSEVVEEYIMLTITALEKKSTLPAFASNSTITNWKDEYKDSRLVNHAILDIKNNDTVRANVCAVIRFSAPSTQNKFIDTDAYFYFVYKDSSWIIDSIDFKEVVE